MNAKQAQKSAADALQQIRKIEENCNTDRELGTASALGVAWATLAYIARDTGESPWQKRLREWDEARKAKQVS